MKKKCVNLFDFDGTIYDGDSTIDFFLFCLKKKNGLIKYFPIQLFYFLLYKLELKDKKCFKEKFFVFLRGIDNLDDYVKQFWNKNFCKIKEFYMLLNKDNDIIISASPQFLLEPIAERLGVMDLIATDMDYNGKINGENCYGDEKVRRLYAKYSDIYVNDVYSDSFSDKPIMYLASNKVYFVKGIRIKDIILKQNGKE